METHFKHQQSAHCETGVASTLLRHHGLRLSEPMVFGIASGLTYACLPFVKINGLPLMAYRMPPRLIIKLLSWRIKGLSVTFKTFKKQADGTLFLNKKLNENQVVGLQTSVYFLPYFPKEMRFHFNAHNLIVYAKSNNNKDVYYHVSDPVFAKTQRIEASNLLKARFAKGALAPKGRLYYLTSVPNSIDFKVVITKAIRFTGKINLSKLIPIAGISGMKKVANKIESLQHKSPRYQQLFLGNIVRMQEEIGTGGAGFRYMYAAFLQESAELINKPELEDWAQQFMVVGDEWREFARLCAQINKNRGDATLKQVANTLREVAKKEEALYNKMASFKL
ncbi:MAG: peptidase [Gammaproteobacteria bacterium]|uniref:Peptidase n=1 Tax=endosymbiont of Bathymodiolus septemdierum str. Myojin knoll TaxID=1303921 RepID=A0A0P0UT79_9GAMM|nr:BtrH N-terminal domain-containing protein [Bathymodiolus septemdierum thioautotrophic gill symbiont]RUA06018.1 MAG: peptidase [Gammaproteobacteria bacterium]BAS68340.1 conserved hypothetical protein [endosymbiont of Bathymodiolus septemdierum str. Myojin knoll]